MHLWPSNSSTGWKFFKIFVKWSGGPCGLRHNASKCVTKRDDKPQLNHDASRTQSSNFGFMASMKISGWYTKMTLFGGQMAHCALSLHKRLMNSWTVQSKLSFVEAITKNFIWRLYYATTLSKGFWLHLVHIRLYVNQNRISFGYDFGQNHKKISGCQRYQHTSLTWDSEKLVRNCRK